MGGPGSGRRPGGGKGKSSRGKIRGALLRVSSMGNVERMQKMALRKREKEAYRLNRKSVAKQMRRIQKDLPGWADY